MSGHFRDLNFLMGSENRIRVLEALAETPHTQEEIVESIDTSAVTVGRILDDFLERRWIERRDDRYAATILGTAVAADTETLEGTVSVAQRFWPVGEYFTPEELDFDPRLLADAKMTRSPDDSAFDHVDHWATLFRAADSFRSFTSNVPVTLMEVLVTEIRERGMPISSVLAGELVDQMMADPEKRRGLREMIVHGAELYRYDDADWDFAVGIYGDELMSIAGFDRVGTPRVKIESRSPALREWAESKCRRYRERSVAITLDHLDE